MKAIRVDPVARTARAEPGLRWTEFDRETQAFGLATTGGTIGDTGIAGLTLGGGFGWLEGKFGMTVDNLLGADVVLADGRLVHASSTEHPDLFWALRGGGGNFGVVTSFEYRLHEVGPLIIGGLVVHPFPRAKEVLKFFGDFLRTAPDELVAAAVLMTGTGRQQGVRHRGRLPGRYRRGRAPGGANQAVRSAGHGRDRTDAIPRAAGADRSSHAAQRTELLEGGVPARCVRRAHRRSGGRIRQRAVAAVVDPVLSDPRSGEPRVARRTAFPHRRGYHFGIYSLWTDPSQNDQNIAWVRQTWTGVQSFVSGGVYVNELGEDDGVDRVEMAFGPNYDRLQRIKAKYDPNNVFRLNANIAPVGV